MTPVTCYINTQHCIFQDPGSLVVFQAPQLLVEDMLQSFFLRLDVGLYIYNYIYIYTVYVCICVYIYDHYPFKIGGRTLNVSYKLDVFQGGGVNSS